MASSTPKPCLYAAVFCALSLTAPSLASAGPFELFGFGPEGAADSGARAARADDGSAAFYNPSGLAFGTGVRLRAAPTLAVSALSVQDQARPLQNPFGMAFAFDATLPLEAPLDQKIRVGLGAYLLPASALHFIVHRSDEPQFPYYDNRSQRLALLPSVAFRLHERAALGLALNVLGGVTGNADVRPGASRAPESQILVEANTKISLNLGLSYAPRPGVRLAFVYRQRFSVPASLVTQAEIGGVPMRVQIGAREALFDPHTFVLATSIDFGKLTMELDASYLRWSDYGGPLLDVSAELPGVLIASRPAPPLFRDIASARLAFARPFSFGAGRSETKLWSRASLGFEPSILNGARQGHTNFVDGHKTMIGLGAEWVWPRFFPKPFHLGLGAGVQFLSDFEQIKHVCAAAPCADTTVFGKDAANPAQDIQNPGYPRLSAGGSFFTFSLGVGVDL